MPGPHERKKQKRHMRAHTAPRVLFLFTGRKIGKRKYYFQILPFPLLFFPKRYFSHMIVFFPCSALRKRSLALFSLSGHLSCYLSNHPHATGEWRLIADYSDTFFSSLFSFFDARKARNDFLPSEKRPRSPRRSTANSRVRHGDGAFCPLSRRHVSPRSVRQYG